MDSFQVRRLGAVVQLSGAVDQANGELLQRELGLAADSGGDVVVDCAGLTFIGSFGVDILIRVADGLNGRRLVLTGGGWGAYVVNLLRLTESHPNLVVQE